MPRSIEEILHQADQLADRFEDHEPASVGLSDAAALRALREAFLKRASAERELAASVVDEAGRLGLDIPEAAGEEHWPQWSDLV